MAHTRREFLRRSAVAALVGTGGIAGATSSAIATPGDLTVGGIYRLTATHSGLSLDVEGGSADDGADVQQWGWSGGDHQRWRLEWADEGSYRLINVKSEKALDVEAKSTDDGANVIQWSLNGGENQQWSIDRQDDGSYRLTSVNSGKVLSVADGATDHGATVHQWTDTGGDEQRWDFERRSTAGAHFDVDDGFATPDWFDDDVTVHRVTEPTRAALESAVQASGPRLVVFETSGTIDLGAERLAVTNDKCWIAGQTAPSPGIALIRGEFAIDANDCVVQHIRSRPGDAGQDTGWEPDAITTADGTSNNVFDHVSASWSVDEVASPGYDTTDTTLSNCLIAEALRDSTHHKGLHSCGSLVGDNATGVALLGNVWALAESRQPRLKAGTRSVVVNNLMYHFGEATNLDDSAEATIESNVYRRVDQDDAVVEGGNAYLSDNDVGGGAPLTNGTTELDARPLWPGGLQALPSDETVDHAHTYAGARSADRSETDRRILDAVANGSGDYIDSQSDVGGYPDLAEQTHSLDVPETGRREWLEQWALSVEVPAIQSP